MSTLEPTWVVTIVGYCVHNMHAVQARSLVKSAYPKRMPLNALPLAASEPTAYCDLTQLLNRSKKLILQQYREEAMY